MEIINKLDEKLKTIFPKKQLNIKILVLFFGCFGIILIFLSELVPAKNIEQNSLSESSFDNYAFEERLEKRLEERLSKIKNAGKTSVMLTLDSSEEYLYARNSSEERDSAQIGKESEIVVIEGESGEEPIVIKSEYAKIRGVLVICEGGDNSKVREKIIEALCALLDIPSNKVSVAKMA